MSRGALIAIVVGCILLIVILVAAIFLGTTDDPQGFEEDITEGRSLTLDLNENLSLKENP